MAALTLDDVRAGGDRNLYPVDILEGCDTALVLFAAAFLGRQDACWIEEAGLTATCVDNDQGRLVEMKVLYPPDWEFRMADAYAFTASTNRTWDIVSVDCPTGVSMKRCADLVDRWCELANRAVVLGSEPGHLIDAPEGWDVTKWIKRSKIAWWTVLHAWM